jgi:flagellar hook-length control protein FliK
MNTISASSVLTTNSVKSPSENLIANSSDKNLDSFKDALQTGIQKISKTKASLKDNSSSSDAKTTTKTHNTHLTVKSQDLLATIWNMKGTPNSTQESLSTSYESKDLSSSIGKMTSDALIETKPNDALPIGQSQDLLGLIWSIQNNATMTQQAPITTAAETSSLISPDIINDTTALALKSVDITNTSPSENTTALVNSDISQTTVVNNPTSSSTPSAISTPSMQSTIPTYPIAPSLGQSGWDEAIGQRVVWMASQNIQTATLNINPEHLGPMQVQIQMDNNQQANVQFFSAQPEVRLALQNAIPLLSQMLEQTGIQLGQSDVSSKNFGSNQQQQKSTPNSLHTESIKLDPTNTVMSNTLSSTSGNGLLNIYA